MLFRSYNEINLCGKLRGGSLDVEYRNKSIKSVCTDASIAEKKYGREMAEKLQRRIDQIRAATSIEEMIQFRIGRCHPLHQNRRNQYAVDLVHPMRLVFEKKGTDIQIAYITEITDYHNH